jgi:predicted nuclease with TOPRIM domain
VLFRSPVAGDKAGKRIQALKEEIKTSYKPKIAELESTLTAKEARLAELEAQAARTKALEDEVAQFKKEMSVVRLEQTPEFVKEVTEPLKTLSDKVASIADTYGLEQSKLVEAITEPDEGKRRSMFKTILSGVEVDIDHAIELRNIASETHKIYAKQDALFQDADAALAELAARREGETAAQAAARAEERGKAADVAASAITKALPFLNDLMPDLSKKVKDTPFETLDPTHAAYNALAGAALPKVKKELDRLQKEHDAVLDELSRYRKATPRAPGQTGTPSPTPQKHTDLAAALMAGAGMIGS